MVPLPQKTLSLLRRFWATHRNPHLLFPAVQYGPTKKKTTLKTMEKGGVQTAFKLALSDSNIHKKASVHTLRHSYTTHQFFGGIIGFTGVLHTHSRRLDFHPHVHFVVPGVAYHPQKQLVIHSQRRFLIPERVLNRLFRGKFFAGLKGLGLSFNPSLYRKDWVVDSRFSGKGDSALKYLSRYLYRGVISEKNILCHHDGQITFQYTDSKTGEKRSRTLAGETFVKLVLQHVLPKGFRKVRDYGFLHGNAKATLTRIQLLLIPKFSDDPPVKRPSFKCPCCGKPMVIIAVRVFNLSIEQRSRSPPMEIFLAEASYNAPFASAVPFLKGLVCPEIAATPRTKALDCQ